MATTLVAVFLAALPALTAAHSGVLCAQYLNGDDTVFNPSNCIGFGRHFAHLVTGFWDAYPFSDSAIDINYLNSRFSNGGSVVDPATCQTMTGGWTPSVPSQVPSPIDSAYSTQYPRPTYVLGQQVCMAWAPHNHAIPTPRDACSPGGLSEGASNRLTITISNRNPTGEDMPLSFFDNRVIAELDFNRCADYCNNQDEGFCRDCFTFPTDYEPGDYTIVWNWHAFDPVTTFDNRWTTCIDARVVAPGDAPPTVPQPTPRPTPPPSPPSPTPSGFGVEEPPVDPVVPVVSASPQAPCANSVCSNLWSWESSAELEDWVMLVGEGDMAIENSQLVLNSGSCPWDNAHSHGIKTVAPVVGASSYLEVEVDFELPTPDQTTVVYNSNLWIALGDITATFGGESQFLTGGSFVGVRLQSIHYGGSDWTYAQLYSNGEPIGYPAGVENFLSGTIRVTLYDDGSAESWYSLANTASFVSLGSVDSTSMPFQQSYVMLGQFHNWHCDQQRISEVRLACDGQAVSQHVSLVNDNGGGAGPADGFSRNLAIGLMVAALAVGVAVGAASGFVLARRQAERRGTSKASLHETLLE